MIPAFAFPADVTPGQFGPITRHPFDLAYGMMSKQSWNGIRSVIITRRSTPASIASIAASFAYGAGTKRMDAFAPVASTASKQESYTGTPWTFSPAFPGVTPATTFVPYSNIFSVWNWPWWPVMPWTMSFVFSSRRTAILGTSRPHLHCQLRGLLHRVRGVADALQDLPRAILVHALDPCDAGDVHT